MNDYIPPKITPEQYDKLTCELWEMKQRLAGAEKTIYSAVEVDKIFTLQCEINEKLAEHTLSIRALTQATTLLLTLCNNKMNGTAEKKKSSSAIT